MQRNWTRKTQVCPDFQNDPCDTGRERARNGELYNGI